MQSLEMKKLRIARQQRPKSAPYLRLKNIQETTVGNIWKKYIFISKKIFLEKLIFIQKSIF